MIEITTPRSFKGKPAEAKAVGSNSDLVEQLVIPAVSRHYPALINSIEACLSVFGTMALGDRTKPLSLIFETPSGFGKSAILQMAFPDSVKELESYVYRSDKFTPKSFVSHAANVEADSLAGIDLLPRLRDKVLLTKELAPILRGRTEELTDNFSILIAVLDGKGFTSDSGMRGRRGYQETIVFNWIGATTPLPAATHRLMSQLGTRLLFYEVPAVEPTKEELLAYAERDDSGIAEIECNAAVNQFLWEFYQRHPVGTIATDSVTIPPAFLEQLVQWARLLVKGRAEIRFDREEHSGEQPVSASPAEGPYKVINYFKELARGHALIHGRSSVDPSDLELVSHVAISSIPGGLRPLIRELRREGSINTGICQRLCGVSHPTARKYLLELELLGIGDRTKGSPKTNEPDTITLAPDFAWLRG